MTRTITLIPLHDLTDHPENAKQHLPDNIAASMDTLGTIDLITRDDRTGYTISGHGRTKALRNLHAQGAQPPEGIQVDPDGTWLVPVVTGWSSKDDNHARAALVTLNTLTEVGGWDQSALLATLEVLAEQDAELLALTTHTDADIAALRQALEPPVQHNDPDDAPSPPVTPYTQQGDVWLLGPHRLAVGDATQTTTWDGLRCDGAACVWTDPPYGVEYVGKTKDALTIQNDGEAGLDELLARVFDRLLVVTLPGSAWYVATPPGPLNLRFGVALAERQVLRQQLVWDKGTMVLGRSDYHYAHEPIYYGRTPTQGEGRAARINGTGWYGPDNAISVLRHPKPNRNTDHPTMKPTSLISECLSNSTKPGDLVVDPFGGSGSTLIAAHDLGRRAAMIELDPKYADVICRRFQEHTGIMPVRERDNHEHDFHS